MTVDGHSPEKIVEILHSITKVSLDESLELDTWFDGKVGNGDIEGINGFIPNSFTRELLELIEKHLKADKYDNDEERSQDAPIDS